MTQQSQALALTPEDVGKVNFDVNVGVIKLATRMKLVDHVISQMVEDTHYGASFPGDKKKNLLKPGADYLGVAFQLVPLFEVERIDLPNAHREYSVNCRVEGPNGQLVTNGLGSCSTMESKYRWRNANKKCPHCGAEAIIKGKADYGGGWICFDKKGGCKSKFADKDPLITEQLTGKVENSDPADQYNTCLKIAKKRAMVDAMITATGCSAQFTQDIEDIRSDDMPKATQQAPAPAQAAKTPLNLVELNRSLEQAASWEEIKAAWERVTVMQNLIQSADLTQLIKTKRATEARMTNGGAQ